MSDVVAESAAPPPEEVGSWRLLVRSFATLAVGEGVARIFGLVAVLLLARRLGPLDFGIVSFALTLVGWFSIVVDSGTELLNVRDIAREPSRFREISERVLGLRLVISVVAAGVFVLAIETLARSNHVRNTVVLFAIVLPATALNLRWMVLGVRAPRSIAVGNIAARVTLATGVVLLVHGSHDLHRVPFLETGAEIVYGAVILVAMARRFGFLRPRVDLSAWVATLRQSTPLLVNAVARAVFYSFDIVIIELFLGPHKVGIYAAGSKPVLFVIGAAGLFSVSFLSEFSAARESDSARRLLRKALRTSAVVALPITVALSSSAVVLLPFLFGHRYTDAGLVLVVLAWRIPIAALTGPYASALISHGRQKALMRNNLIAAAALAAGDLVAIPLLGILGAAAASVVASALVLGLNYRAFARLESDPSAFAPAGVADVAGARR